MGSFLLCCVVLQTERDYLHHLDLKNVFSLSHFIFLNKRKNEINLKQKNVIGPFIFRKFYFMLGIECSTHMLDLLEA